MLSPDRQVRAEDIRASMSRVKAIARSRGINRDSLVDILEALKKLAARREYWQAEEFPPPELPERQARYLISQDEDQSFTLYLNVFRPGKPIPPHNHTTWACVAAVQGEEINHVYRRTDDGSAPGRGTLEHVREVVVAPGQGIALMPEDIHRVEIRGDQPIRHLHLYGKALETLAERVMFDMDRGEVRAMGVGVASRRHTRID
jgi:predicted metal-dependent enzyme (double-stranded beta helix superfamily)